MLCLILPYIAFSQCLSVVTPSNIVVNNDVGLCGATVLYQQPSIVDSCSIMFFEDFETGSNGWTKGSFNDLNNWTVQDVSGVGTAMGSNMFGVPHAGNYAYGGTEYSYVNSPVFNTSGGGNISFDFFVNNEPAVHDQEIIQISFDGGISWNQVNDTQLPNNEFSIQTTVIHVSSIEGTEITVLRFIYNTVDACCGAQDGFFIDNVKFESEQIASVQLISGLGSGAVFPIGTTTEVYQFFDGSISDTISFTVTVNSTYNTEQTLSICYGESVTVGINNYSTFGVYLDTLTSQSGCDSIVTTNLTVKSSIDTTLVVDGMLIVANELDASYQWFTCGNVNQIIYGENNREFTALKTGNYAVVLTREGCTKTSSIVNVTTVNAEDIFKKSSVVLFPNPFNDKVTIDLGDLISANALTIIDLSGKVWYQLNSNKINAMNLDLGFLNAGIYFLQIENNEGQKMVNKLVKN